MLLTRHPHLYIGPWQGAHAVSLTRALGPPDVLTGEARAAWGDDRDGLRWRRTLVAEVAGDLVGVVTAFASPWHPARLWIGLEVAPEHRRRGIGGALLAASRGAAGEDGRALRGKVFARSPAASFAQARGFRVLQRSRTFRLEGKSAPPSPYFTVEASALPGQVARAFLDFYVRSHRWDPPRMDADDIRGSHVDGSVAAFLVLGAGGEPLAVGCLYDDEEGLVLSGGPTDPGAEHAGAATGALLDACLAHAAAMNRHGLLVEADDDPPQVVAELEARGASVLDEVHIVAER